MDLQLPATLISQRYQLIEQIGEGGMGEVYRALDRLTGTTVALKRVLTRVDHLAFRSRALSTPQDSDGFRISLAQEFQTLASLRHPHIINVLDYGFDHEGHPYFIMDLLERAKTIIENGHGQPIDYRIDLLAQTLRALAYLHRRGILHRDLTPNNVLVVDGQIKLLDFGLAEVFEHASGVVGTLAYIAPEVLIGEPATTSADLYNIGVIAYELLVGQHPFHTDDDLTALLDSIQFDMPDMRPLNFNPLLGLVIERLLAKQPDQRYHSAEEVIEALRPTTDHPLAIETEVTRESFLQAARLVERESELAKLTAALRQASVGKGGSWLIGGESGVGKSRLVSELRIIALVQGVLAVVGQAGSAGNAPYQLWRDPLRRLVLNVDLSELEISVLSTLIPDIGTLLDRLISAIPDLEPQAAQARLFSTIAGLIARQPQPILIILEDLHWADAGSLSLLSWLYRTLDEQAVLILGTFRDDERAELTAELPTMPLLKLPRLSDAGIAALSALMLGPTGYHEPIFELLKRESEGNVFFLVEIVRALAEDAGQLDRVGVLTLPDQISTGGVRRVIQRRLSRVPAEARPLLELAAIAGRELDLPLLRRVTMTADLESTLRQCANVAVLEVLDYRWRFAHDKLRETLIAELAAEHQQALHRQLADAITQVYTDNLTPYYAALVYHYGQAQCPEQECYYAGLAGIQAAERFAHQQALTYLNRALVLTPNTDLAARYRLLITRERVYDLQGLRGAQQSDLEALGLLAQALNDPQKRAQITLRQASYASAVGDLPAAIDLAQQAAVLAQTVGDAETEAGGYFCAGEALRRQAKYRLARTQLDRALELAQTANLPRLASHSTRMIGYMTSNQGNYVEAKNYVENSLAMARAIGDRQSEGRALLLMSHVSRGLDNAADARSYYEQAMKICYEVEDRWAQAAAFLVLGAVQLNQGNFTQAYHCYTQGLSLTRTIQDRTGESSALLVLSDLYRKQGDYATAQDYGQQALSLFRKIGSPFGQGMALLNWSLSAGSAGNHQDAYDYSQQALRIAQEIQAALLTASAFSSHAHALTALGRLAEAEQCYQQAFERDQQLHQSSYAMEALAGLVRVYLAQGDQHRAAETAEQILQHLANGPLVGAEEPFRVYLTCYQYLKAVQDSRAPSFLENTRAMLQATAAKISDEATRRSFLENVPYHRALMAARHDTIEGADRNDTGDQ